MKPLRSGTSWSLNNGIIEDKTRSGKTKRRLATSQSLVSFQVRFYFNSTQYNLFCTWWKEVCRYGLNSFRFKKIDSISNEDYEYRIVAGQNPSFNNPSGDIIECSMQWEEVGKVI